MSAEPLWERLWRRHIYVSRPASADEVVVSADALLSQATIQSDLLEYLVEQLRPNPADIRRIQRRWLGFQPRLLSRFAPYAYHCLRTQIAAMVTSRHRLVRSQTSDMLDAQYLYYLPFCQHFSSSDRLHLLLAPKLMAPGQVFIPGAAMKRDLALAAAQRRAKS